MPSPATRSGRLTKAKQPEEEQDKESKDASNKKARLPSSPSRASARNSNGSKSPKASQESNESALLKTRSKRSATQDDSGMESNSPKKTAPEISTEKANKSGSKISPLNLNVKMEDDTKKSEGDSKKLPDTPIPVSGVRRSSRAPVPSSKFKDMEVLTPNSQKSKRLLALSSPDSTSEPSPKKSRKNSTKSSEIVPDDNDKECPLSPPKIDKGFSDVDADKNVALDGLSVKDVAEGPTISVQKDASCPPVDEKNESRKDVDAQIVKEILLTKDVEVAAQSTSSDGHIVEEMEVGHEDMEVADQLVELSTIETGENVVVNAIAVEVSTEKEEEEKHNAGDETAVVTSEIALGATDDSTEPASQEVPVPVEEVGLSCQDGGLIIEETVHTFMDEKDVVIQSADISNNMVTAEEMPTISEVPKEIELSLDRDTTTALSSHIMLKGQEVTVQERDGKMVAIVKIPGSLSNMQNIPSHTEAGSQVEESSSLLSSNSKNIILNVASTPKSRHGYILNKKPEKQSFLTMSSDQDQNTINISVEPTTMSSILKSKTPEPPAKSTPKSLYGRVIKQETVTTKSNTGVSPVVQNTSPSTSVIIKNAGSNQKVSLLPQSIKATNPKECKPYSLLSSPSELLQKLKSDSEKKQAATTTTTTTTVVHEQPQKSPKKVVIITHPPKSGGQVETNSISSSVLKDGVSSTIEPEIIGPSGQMTVESTIITTDSEFKSDSIPTQDEMTEVTTMEVVEEVSNEVSQVAEIEAVISLSDKDVPEQVENSETPVCTVVESSTEVELEGENVQSVVDDDLVKTKELIVESMAVTEGGDIHSDILIPHEEDKSTVEETVITSDVQNVIEVKQEIETETIEQEEEKIEELQLTKEKGKSDGPKTQKIKLVDNGVVYELQIVSDGETKALEVQNNTIEFGGVSEEEGVMVKQEIVDEDGNTSSTDTLGKSTLGTQTVYAAKRGRPRASGDKDDADAPVHKLATIVQEGGQKKHFYYVSVVPGKTMDGKYRRSVEHILPGCVVSDTGEYCCRECDYKTDKKANFYKHRRLHTGSKPHVCQVCKYQARTSSNLKRHMGIHEDIREFKCSQCALSFRQKIHLERHIRYRHEEKRIKCPMCDYVCANEQPDLKMHIKRKHTQESGKVFTCPQCNIEVGSKRDLKQHLKFHKDGPELKLFCKECSFVTDCKSRLQRHLVVHSNVKPYHCGVCDYKATQKEHVVRHLRSQHKIEVNKPKRPWKKQVKQESGENFGGTSRGDFTCGDKIFACNHCTMRFAKLINLYKHLHTQHSDIMPAETESNYYCVVCEFSTSSKKNLLVHMRRHNMTDQTPPTHVYSCVLCRYVNPRRRNLFQHMRKKHNIDISTQVDIAGMTEEEEAAVRQDGDKMAEFIQTDSGVFTQANAEEIATTSSFETVDGSSPVIKDNLAGVANMIKIEDLTRVAAGVDGKDSSTDLVIDNGDGTHIITGASLMQHKAADAIEGLQALAGQAGLIIDEEAIETKPTIVIEQTEGGVIATDGTLADGSSIILSADQTIVEEQVATIEEASEQIQQIVESVESADANASMTSLELTEEQLSSLHHGDIVQMEGQVYMVELAQDPDSPDKQLLSFLPISQG